ncbi:MAG: hypothetical protein ACLPMG_02710 [Terriglobales bacterium]
MPNDDLNPNSGTQDEEENFNKTPSPQASPESIPAANPQTEPSYRKQPRLFIRIWHIHRKRQQRVSPPNVAEKITVFLIVVTAAIGAVQAIIYSQQKRIMESQTRPWIGIAGPIELVNDGLRIKLMNYGQSAGLIAKTPVFGYTYGGRNGRWFDQHQICEKSEQALHELDNARTVDTIFPGKDGLIDKIVPLQEFIPGALQEGNNTGKLLIVGCIAYMSQMGAVYYTRVGYYPTKTKSVSANGTESYPITGWEQFYTDTTSK